MYTYVADIIPKIQKFSRKLDDMTLLMNQHWVLIEEGSNVKTVYIFRSNNDLLISLNGKVQKAKWDYLGNRSLLIDIKDDSYLLKLSFHDENIAALKVDSKEEYAFMVNEEKYFTGINSISNIIKFLNTEYISKDLDQMNEDIITKELSDKEVSTIVIIIITIIIIFSIVLILIGL
ncbi:MAG: hypothetical protein IPG60_13965 [Bacteroidetes bacterium]|nr:hypothetical protein [Bacteroidota bacterium]